MANEVEIVVTSRDASGPGMDSARRSATGLGSAFGKLGELAKIAGGFIVANLLTQGVDKLIRGFDTAITAASDLGESVNAVTQIFDASAPAIIAWGEANANALGLSRRAFQQLATPLGAMLKNSGLSMKDVEKNTIALTERAADMASVFNTDVSDALEAIQAGLRGESDPLERYGVGLSAAKVETQALADTGKKSAAMLTEQEKQLARLKILFAQTNDVAGDFRNTADGYANSARIAAAKTEELNAKIGERLMPIAQKMTQVKLALVSAISDKLLPALDKAAVKFEPLRRAIAEHVLPALQRLSGWIQEKVLPVVAKLVDEYVSRGVEAFHDLQGVIKDNEVELRQLGEWLEKIANFIIEKVVPVVGPVLANGFKVAINQISFMITVVSTVIRVWNGAVDFFKKLPGRITAAASGMWDGIKAAFRGAINWIIDRWNSLEFRVPGFSAFGFSVPGVTLGLPDIPRLAQGGIRGGWAMLGERGAELVKLPQGSQVYSAAQSHGMLERGEAGGRGMTEVMVTLDPSLSGPTRDLVAAVVKALRFAARPYGGSVDALVRAAAT